MRHVDVRCPFFRIQADFLGQPPAKLTEHPADTRIIELARYRRIDRNIFVSGLKLDVVSLPLLANIPQRILGAAFVIFIQYDQVGKIEHIYFLELAGRAVVTGHYIDGKIDHIDDFTVTLTDARCLNQNKIEAE